jgi:acylphosphatase
MRRGFRFVVWGHVQGVWFRAFAQEQARTLGLAGWVRNRLDGAVEGAAWGSAEALAAFRAQLEQGPPVARVERIQIEPDVPVDADTHDGASFEIRH